MSASTQPQDTPKPIGMTLAQLSAVPNFGQLSPADTQILTLMLGPKPMAMEAALLRTYPHLSPTQVQGCVGFLLADPQVRAILKFVTGVTPPVPGAPPVRAAVKPAAPTERISLNDLWARPEFLALAPVQVNQNFDLSLPPTRKVNTQKILAMYFTLARRDWSAAVSMTSSQFTLEEIAEVATKISEDAAIQNVLALVAGKE